MKAVLLPCICLLCTLSACSGWPAAPYSYSPATIVPSSTPRIQTPTPIVFSPTPQAATTDTPTASETATVAALTPSETPSATPTATPLSIQVDILGCDTGIDVLHGLEEVTNAYVTIANPTGTDFENVCATLHVLNETAPNPDSKKCVPTLPSGHQVTFQLTANANYKAAEPIQVEVASGDSLLARVGEPACQDIGLLLPAAGGLGVITPIPTP